MPKVAYSGPFDVRELVSEDLKKAEVEGFKAKAFPRNEPVEVSQEVADALLKHSTLFGNFTVVEEEVTEELTQVEEPATQAQEELPVEETTPNLPSTDAVADEPSQARRRR